MISKKLLSEVLGPEYSIEYIKEKGNYVEYNDYDSSTINIYELAHKSLKKWAITNCVFGIIDWSGTPEQIFSKAEKLRNELDN